MWHCQGPVKSKCPGRNWASTVLTQSLKACCKIDLVQYDATTRMSYCVRQPPQAVPVSGLPQHPHIDWPRYSSLGGSSMKLVHHHVYEHERRSVRLVIYNLQLGYLRLLCASTLLQRVLSTILFSFSIVERVKVSRECYPSLFMIIFPNWLPKARAAKLGVNRSLFYLPISC